MLIDGREIPHCGDLQADICIIGGGAAGIFLAVLFGRAGFDTLVLEAGGLALTENVKRSTAATSSAWRMI
jgi:2-polyprenyl-6-methoxyphenol hydroxylase-like FAD-dependent oxidoreductase